MKLALTVFVLGSATVVSALPCWAANLTAVDIAKTLDITSFPNSVRPGLQPRTRTLAQNGFTVIVPTARDLSSVEVHRPDRQWLFEIKIRRSSKTTAVICVLDQALNGGTYRTLDGYEVRRGRDGLLHNSGREVHDPACEMASAP